MDIMDDRDVVARWLTKHVWTMCERLNTPEYFSMLPKFTVSISKKQHAVCWEMTDYYPDVCTPAY